MQPTTPVLISIVNASTKVSDAEVAAAVPAFGKQIANDFAPVWGGSCAIEFVPSGQKPNGNVIATLRDSIDVPEAAGYHDRNAQGYAYIEVAVLDGMDWRTTMSHELLELLGDWTAGAWDDGPDGSDYAHEMCDAVESDTYDIDGVPVSNFVYRAFFNPTANAADKLDHLGTLPKPFAMSAGGYQIKRTEPGKVTQIFAAHAALGHSVHVAATCHETATGHTILVVFGAEYPDAKKSGKVEKVRRRFVKRAVA